MKGQPILFKGYSEQRKQPSISEAKPGDYVHTMNAFLSKRTHTHNSRQTHIHTSTHTYTLTEPDALPLWYSDQRKQPSISEAKPGHSLQQTNTHTRTRTHTQ